MTTPDIVLTCPNSACRKVIALSFREVLNNRKATCGRCRAALEFDSTAVNELNNAKREHDRAGERLERASTGLLQRVRIKLP